MKQIFKTSPGTAVKEYAVKIRAFKPNARFFLINVVITGTAIGIFHLLFNFYVLSLGFDEVVLGGLITISSLTALLAAIPIGYLADLLGRKTSLVLSTIFMSISVAAMVLRPNEAVFYTMSVVSGLAQSLMAVSMAPFLMENSSEQERTYLFSIIYGLQALVASVGTWLGGYLPSWVAGVRMVSPNSSIAYGHSLLIVSILMASGWLPLLFIKVKKMHTHERSVFAPIQYAKEHPAELARLILPMLITSIGAGLVMPFMNIFFRQVYHQSDQVIGTLFAWGTLAMGIGLIIAPPLADRMGKIQLVVITQALSIPFLVLLGFSPMFWLSAAAYYVRLALMNMSTPVYDTYVMEHVDESARATVASLVSMSSSFGWAFSPTISGWLQVHYGFGPPFIGTLILYCISIYFYWRFFWKKSKQVRTRPVQQSSV
jgi:MFS family permease